MHDVLGDDRRQALLDALLRHDPADDGERRDVLATRALVEAEPRCFDRTVYLPGHVTGSAFVVDAASGRVLLHHHARLGRWLQEAVKEPPARRSWCRSEQGGRGWRRACRSKSKPPADAL